MKILRLRFKNIHSLKGENEIDFTALPLVDTGIFAIIGATGSGKSTILDVISLALFNRTPRMGAISKSAVENYGSIVTRNTDECYCEVEYEVNARQYRSKWSISKARTGNFRDYNMELSSLPDNTFLDVKRSKVPDKNIEIIGLNYDQFVKSILLSQGEFARFLKADANERGELLEKITGTEIYRNIGKAAFERHKAEQQKLDNLIAIKETYKLLDKNEIEGFKKQENDLTQQTEKRKKQLEAITKLREIKTRLRTLDKENKQLEKRFQELQQEKKEFEKQTSKLKRHEKILPLKSDIKELVNNQKQIKELLTKNQKQTEAIKALQKQQENLHERFLSYEKEKETLEEQHEKLKPILKEVRELDKKTEVVLARINDQEKTIRQQKNNIDKRKQQQKQIEKQIEDKINEKQKYEQWLDDNSILRSVGNEIRLIEEITQKYNKIEKVALQAVQEYKKNTVGKKIARAKKWDEKAVLIDDAIFTNLQTAETLEKELEYVSEDMPKLIEETEYLKQAIANVEKLLTISEEYNDADKKKTVLENENKENAKHNEDNTKEKNKLQHEIEITNKHIEELKLRNERQQLEAKYSDDRKKLLAGEPCYLCGSLTHPYVKQYTNHSSETKKLLHEKEKELKKFQAAMQQCEKHGTALETNITSNNKQLHELKNKIQKLKNDFSQINIADTNFSISNHSEMNNYHARQKTELKYKTGQKQKLEQYIDNQNDIQKLQNLKEKTQEVLESRENIKRYFQKYKKYIANVKDSNQIVPQLTKADEQYQKTGEALIGVKEAIHSNKKLSDEIISTIKDLTFEFETAEKEFSVEKKKLSELQNKRKNLLGNRLPEQVEEDAIKKIRAKQNQISETANKLTGLDTEIKAKKQQISENKQTISGLDENVAALQTRLQPQIHELNYQNMQQVLDDLLTDNEVKQIAARDKQLQQKEIELKQSLADKQSEMEQNRQHDDDRFKLEEVIAKQEKLSEEIETNHREIGVIQTKLSENEKNTKAFQEHNQEVIKQERETLRWKNLKNLIGDAEGKNFAKFAQELTLIQLIALANKHLQTLNDRYVIQKGDNKLKEELVVRDTYQGNAERSVKTLSGGESFLVSLALALALSDLAGKNTKIDSLFIDEGFGSLDQETLDVALTALEKLQSESKRTIGIISHVESLKERITTHIALKKGNAGFSSIDIR